MTSTYILWPVLAQILLTFAVLVILAARRAVAFKTGKVNKKQVLLDARAWPEEVIKASNNFTSQFEMPVLFYVLCLGLVALGAVSNLAIVFASVFAISRYIHTYVHIGSNYVPYRFAAFATGCLMLLGLAAITGLHCLS